MKTRLESLKEKAKLILDRMNVIYPDSATSDDVDNMNILDIQDIVINYQESYLTESEK